MVSSGVMRLMEAKQVLKLSRLYKEIKSTSFEAERIRLSHDEWASMEAYSDQKAELVNKYHQACEKHYDRSKNLTTMIDEVLKEDWWNK